MARRQTFDRVLLRKWRAASGLKPEQVCVDAGISYSYLRAVEEGARSPSADVLTRLCNVYGQDVRALFGELAGSL